MKTKILTLIMSLIIITLSVIACVEIPMGNETASADPSVSGTSETQKVSEPADSSVQQSSQEASAPESHEEQQSEPSSEETSEPSESSEQSEEVSAVNPPLPEDYPYQNVGDFDSLTIKADALDDYFRDSVFIGNSVFVHFYNYVDGRRYYDSGFLGGAGFLCASAYSAMKEFEGMSQWLPKYKGENIHAWDGVKAMGAKTVYLSLMALNELGLHNTATCVQDTFDNTVKMIDKIKEVNPGVTVVLMSNTYMVESHNGTRLNSNNIRKLNQLALDYCNSNGIDFIDVSTILTGSDGNLILSYCLDPQDGGNGCHLIQKCYKGWTAILRNYAYAKQNGGYANPTEIK